jgi:hypothetical protein
VCWRWSNVVDVDDEVGLDGPGLWWMQEKFISNVLVFVFFHMSVYVFVCLGAAGKLVWKSK